MTTTQKYTYTIFDANPHATSGCAWSTHQRLEIEVESDGDAAEFVTEVMGSEAEGLNVADGYEVGQVLHAIIWDADDVIVSEPTYELTAEDLGLKEKDELTA